MYYKYEIENFLSDITESDINKIIDIVKVLEKRESAHIFSKYILCNFSDNYVIGDFATEKTCVKALFFPNAQLKEEFKELTNFKIVKTVNDGGYIQYYYMYDYILFAGKTTERVEQECKKLDPLDYYNFDERKVYNNYKDSINIYNEQLNMLNTITTNFKKDGSERKDKLKNIIYKLYDRNVSPTLEYTRENMCRINFESYSDNLYFSFNKSLEELKISDILEKIEDQKIIINNNIKDYKEKIKRIKEDVAAYLEAKKKLDKFEKIKYILH